MRLPKLLRAWFMDTVDELHRQNGVAQGALLAERALRIELERRCASQATTIDWLAAELTQARLERAVLVERAFQVTLPVARVEREAPQETSTANRIDPAAIRAFASSLEMPRNVPSGAPAASGDDFSALAAAAGVSFDDPGDEVAARMGLAHDAVGEVVSK